jgi:transcriptional regulator with XRE-family HTH domain
MTAQRLEEWFMYNAELLKTRIKGLCKVRNVSIKEMLSVCGLSINAVSQINDAGGMYSFSLARIADYLDCSVDYLLGRTDKPEVNR